MRNTPAALLAAISVVLAAACTSQGPVAAVRLPATKPAAANLGAGWTTYHHDNSRTGYDPTAPAIVDATPVSQWHNGVDSNVYAEPLVWNGMVIVATENDSLYAFDETSGNLVWHQVVGSSVPTHYCASEIDPIGITSTPVIDTTTNIVYAVGLVTGPKYQMFARNLADGSNVARFPVDITPTVSLGGVNITLDPTVEEQRGALGLANGHVYVPFGGWLGDCGNYHPWVVSVPTTGGAVDHNYEPQTSTQREAGIWAGQGMSIDGSGNIYVATGNGGTGSTGSCSGLVYDHGNGVFKLSPTLTELSSFAPSNWCNLSQQDQDVGSIAPSLLNNGIVFQTGKWAQVYLLNSAGFPGIGAAALNASTQITTCASGDAIYGGAAYVAPDVFIPCNSSGSLQALTVSTTSPFGFSTHWTAGGYTPGPPIVEGGLVWTLSIGGSALYGYNMNGTLVVNVALPQGVRHFATPAADGDWIFVPQTTGITALNFAGPSGPSCGANPCKIYTVDGYGGVNADANSPAIGNFPHFSSPLGRAGHYSPAGIGVTPPTAGLVLDGYGGLHPYGSPSLTPGQYPYFPGFDIARDFVWLPNGAGGYELDGWGGIHPFSIGSNPLPPQPGQYPYFQGSDVAKKITLLSDGSGGYVLDAYGGIHPWSVTGHALPTPMAEYAYWSGFNIARDIFLFPSSTATAANGYVLDGYGGFHPFWSATAAVPATMGQYPYWSGSDIGRSLWFLPSATTASSTGYELDGSGGIHPFASSGQSLPVALGQYPYWSGQDIARTLFGA
jgi:putative pyrroloquinoline-quinone binding quinoprotein